MIFDVSDPAYFGDVIYQNLEISNEGWEPATNIKIVIDRPIMKGEFQSIPPFNLDSVEENILGGFDRIRRNETIKISFSISGKPIEPEMVKIKSDRSIASIRPQDNVGDVWFLSSSFFVAVAIWLAIGVIISIVAPAYKTYSKMKKEMEEEVLGSINKNKQEK